MKNQLFKTTTLLCLGLSYQAWGHGSPNTSFICEGRANSSNQNTHKFTISINVDPQNCFFLDVIEDVQSCSYDISVQTLSPEVSDVSIQKTSDYKTEYTNKTGTTYSGIPNVYLYRLQAKDNVLRNYSFRLEMYTHPSFRKVRVSPDSFLNIDNIEVKNLECDVIIEEN